jgi:hypothetical protein
MAGGLEQRLGDPLMPRRPVRHNNHYGAHSAERHEAKEGSFLWEIV